MMMPTHRSYFDFLLMSFIGFAFELTPPHIVAAEDFLNLGCGPQCGPIYVGLGWALGFVFGRRGLRATLPACL